MLTLALVMLAVPALIAGALSSLAPRLTFHDLAEHVKHDPRLRGPRIPSLDDYAQALQAMTPWNAPLHFSTATPAVFSALGLGPLAQHGGLFSGTAAVKADMEAFERAIGVPHDSASALRRSAPQYKPSFHESAEPPPAKPPCDCQLCREP